MADDSLRARITKMPFKLVPPNTVTRILQGRLRGTKWIIGSNRNAYWLGTYEKSKRVLFEQTIQRDQVVYDVGANVGYYTLLASVLVGPRGKVYAFEPLPANLVYLRKHLELNHITNVEIIEAAVAETSGTASFDPGPNGSVGSLSTGGALRVRAVRLDDLLQSGQILPPHCLKIDVEGAELQVLRGARHILAHRPNMFIATHGNTLLEECIDFLGQLNYPCKILERDRAIERGEIFAGYGGFPSP